MLRGLTGQGDAVRAVSDAVRRTRADIADPDCPTGSSPGRLTPDGRP
ncbi:hypothetical protein [Streptomyces lavendulae]